MRGPGSAVTCVRTLSGEILTRREAEIPPQDRRRWPRFPVLRGMSAVYESLLLRHAGSPVFRRGVW